MKRKPTSSAGLFDSDTSNDPPVKSSYKQTEAGTIPTDWDALPLRLLGRCLSGGTPRLSNRRLWGGDIPWVSSKDMKVPRISDSIDHVTELATTRGTRLVNPGTILIVVRGMSLLHSLPVALVERPVTFNQDLKAFVPAPDVNPEFILGWLQTAEPRLLLLATEATHGTKRLPVPDLMATHIGLPGREEQDAIAHALSDVDGLLGALEKLIAKKRAIKQAAVQQLLTGKTRLPGFTGKWETKRLGELLLRVIGGGTPSRRVQGYWGGSIPWMTVKDFSSFTPTGTEESITEAGLACSSSNLIPPYTVIVATRMAVGRAAMYDVQVAINQDLKALVTGGALTHRYLLRWLEHNQASIDQLGSGSTVKGLSISELRRLEIALPAMQEQEAIVAVLADMDGEIEALERRRGKTRQIKQGMMQQLLTGRIRLVKPEAQAPAARADSDGKATKPHSWAFNEAVVISTLAKHFGSENYPLGRKRYTKFSYLLHRHAERQAEGYLKKAAGPYNPKTKYGGPERIALESGYIREHKNGPYTGFVATDNIAKAEGYFEKWYGTDTIQWLEQFRKRPNDDLELLATVDMAVEELCAEGQVVDVDAVKALIRRHSEWRAKLNREVFSDANIARAIEDSRKLFGNEVDH